MSFLADLLEERSKKGLVAPCFYTTGFADKDFTLLPDLLNFLDAVLIDIRFVPTTNKQIQWRKKASIMMLPANDNRVKLGVTKRYPFNRY